MPGAPVRDDSKQSVPGSPRAGRTDHSAVQTTVPFPDRRRPAPPDPPSSAAPFASTANSYSFRPRPDGFAAGPEPHALRPALGFPLRGIWPMSGNALFLAIVLLTSPPGVAEAPPGEQDWPALREAL